MTEQNRRRWALVIVVSVCLGALGGLFFFAKGNLVSYWTPTEMQSALAGNNDDYSQRVSGGMAWTAIILYTCWLVLRMRTGR